MRILAEGAWRGEVVGGKSVVFADATLKEVFKGKLGRSGNFSNARSRGIKEVLGLRIDKISLLGSIPLEYILMRNIFVGFKNKLDPNDQFSCRVNPFNRSMEFGLMIEVRQSAA